VGTPSSSSSRGGWTCGGGSRSCCRRSGAPAHSACSGCWTHVPTCMPGLLHSCAHCRRELRRGWPMGWTLPVLTCPTCRCCTAMPTSSNGKLLLLVLLVPLPMCARCVLLVLVKLIPLVLRPVALPLNEFASTAPPRRHAGGRLWQRSSIACSGRRLSSKRGSSRHCCRKTSVALMSRA